MENSLPDSPKQGFPAANHDAKYVSGLSTILVATIQEAKDRISQIEYIFCSQLFPNFQSSFNKNLQKIYSEAREAAESKYKEKEKDLNLQIENLQNENQCVLEENQRLKLRDEKYVSVERQTWKHLNQLLEEKSKELEERKEGSQNLEKLLESKSSLLLGYEKETKELEMKNFRLLEMQRRLLVETEECRVQLTKSSSEINDKDIQLKEYEEKTSKLNQKLENLENRVHELVLGIRDKTEQFDKGKELQGNLFKKIEFQAAEIMDNEQLLNSNAKENMLLASKVESLVSDADELKREISKKDFELERLQKVTNVLLQKTRSCNCKRINSWQGLDEVEKVLRNQNGLEENVDTLEKCPSKRAKESYEGMESSEKLLLQIEMKDSELQSERKKRRDTIAAYKRLKSQYSYLFEKYALTQENMLPHDKMEEENKIMDNEQLLNSHAKENIILASKVESLVRDADELKREISKKDFELEMLQKVTNVLLQKARSCNCKRINSWQGLDEVEKVLRNQNGLEENVDTLEKCPSKRAKESYEGMESSEKLLLQIEMKDSELESERKKRQDTIAAYERLKSKCNYLFEKYALAPENMLPLDKMEEKNKVMDNEQLLNSHAKENMLLASKVESLVSDADELKREISKKDFELERLQKVTNVLLQKTRSYNCKRMNSWQGLNEVEKVLRNQNDLEENVDTLEKCPSKRAKESYEGMESSEKLLLQIEMKDSELESERKKRRDTIAAYERLKSKCYYLFEKYALTPENMLPLDKMEEENKIIEQNQTPMSPHDIGHNKEFGIANDERKSVDEPEAVVHKEENRPGRSTSSSPSTSGICIGAKCPGSTVSYPPSGVKRPHSYWRNTRSHQSRVVPDHHDDFLDTPLENIRHNLGKVKKEDVPEAGPLNMAIDSSDDDETQNMNAEAPLQKLDIPPPPKSGPSGFKYVEPVRKKAERENLKGIECKQCKKFYDAVIPAAGKDSSHDQQNLRCEHHEGVSRHRYRYAPPLTPDGFWNIGFESEM